MGLLSREALLGATSLPQQTIHIHALGGDVIVRGMNGKDRDAFEASLLVGKGRGRHVSTDNIRGRLAARCLVHPDGRRMFSDEEADQLGAIRADVLSPIYDLAQKLSGVSDEDIDELGKRSEKADSGTSSST